MMVSGLIVRPACREAALAMVVLAAQQFRPVAESAKSASVRAMISRLLRPILIRVPSDRQRSPAGVAKKHAQVTSHRLRLVQQGRVGQVVAVGCQEVCERCWLLTAWMSRRPCSASRSILSSRSLNSGVNGEDTRSGVSLTQCVIPFLAAKRAMAALRAAVLSMAPMVSRRSRSATARSACACSSASCTACIRVGQAGFFRPCPAVFMKKPRFLPAVLDRGKGYS